MPNKKVTVFDKDDDKDKLDQVINNLNNISRAGSDNDKIDRQQTILDEYLETLKLRRQIAYTLFREYLLRLIQNGGDPAEIEKASAMIGMYLGLGDRWSNEVLKSAVNGEMNMYGGFVLKLLPEYIGDPIANFERSQSIGIRDDTSVLISNLLGLIGLNLSPETIDKIVKMLKDKVGEK